MVFKPLAPGRRLLPCYASSCKSNVMHALDAGIAEACIPTLREVVVSRNEVNAMLSARLGLQGESLW